MKLPQARNKNLVVKELDDEMLVYDLNNHKALHLNKIVGLVWKNCDGVTSLETVTNLLETELNIKIEEDFIWLALNELEKSNLLEGKVNREAFPRVSRRKVLLRYALPTVAFPLIASLIAPAAVNAQSCLQETAVCITTSDNCCPGLVCSVPLGAAINGTCVAVSD